jgi:hypothetical protein
MSPRGLSHFGRAVASLLVMACGPAGDAADAPAVSDSAGIRIVHNATSQFERAGSPWRVSRQPQVVIGAESGEAAYLFDRIMGVQRLADGRWVVADMGGLHRHLGVVPAGARLAGQSPVGAVRRRRSDGSAE